MVFIDFINFHAKNDFVVFNYKEDDVKIKTYFFVVGYRLLIIVIINVIGNDSSAILPMRIFMSLLKKKIKKILNKLIEHMAKEN